MQGKHKYKTIVPTTFALVSTAKFFKMKKTDEDFVSTVGVLESVFTKYESVWSTNPIFSAKIVQFRALSPLIMQTAAGAKIITKGASDDKTDAAFAACDLAADLARRASIYALENINLETHDQLRASRGMLSQMPDKDLSARLHDLYNRMVALGEPLAPYVTPEELEKLQKLIDAYDKITSRPRELIIERRIFNQTFPEQRNEMRKIYYKLDSLISFFKGTEFEQAYRNARRIVRSSARKPKKKDEEKEKTK